MIELVFLDPFYSYFLDNKTAKMCVYFWKPTHLVLLPWGLAWCSSSSADSAICLNICPHLEVMHSLTECPKARKINSMWLEINSWKLTIHRGYFHSIYHTNSFQDTLDTFFINWVFNKYLKPAFLNSPFIFATSSVFLIIVIHRSISYALPEPHIPMTTGYTSRSVGLHKYNITWWEKIPFVKGQSIISQYAIKTDLTLSCQRVTL